MKSATVSASEAIARPPSALQRRGLLLGTLAAGAAAIVTRAVPVAANATADAAAASMPDFAAGYRPSAHVLRYYETAKV